MEGHDAEQKCSREGRGGRAHGHEVGGQPPLHPPDRPGDHPQAVHRGRQEHRHRNPAPVSGILSGVTLSADSFSFRGNLRLETEEMFTIDCLLASRGFRLLAESEEAFPWEKGIGR